MSRFISFDYAMKHLLRNKANFEVLEGFLSELIQEDIKVKSILESESNQETKDDKYNRVDLLVEAGDQKQIIIEVQCTSQWDYLSRILYGTSKTVTEHLKQGSGYINIKKVISVSIVYFKLGDGKDYIYRGRTNFEGMYIHDQLQLGPNEKSAYGDTHQFPYDIYPEYYILRVDQFRERIKHKFDEWMYFLKTEMIKPEFKAKGLQSAFEKLDVLKLSEDERQAYERYQQNLHYEASMVESHYIRGEKEGREQGKAEGEQIGLEKGEKIGAEKGEKIGAEKEKLNSEKKLEEERQASERKVAEEKEKMQAVVKSLKSKKMSVEDIVEITGLSQDEIDVILARVKT